jgi:hypothetical protein
MVASEFKAQTDDEKARGLDVTPFMDIIGPIAASNKNVAKLNLGFINYVVEPLWNSLADFFPELKVCTDNLKENKDVWQAVITKAEEEEALAAAEGGKQDSSTAVV